MKRYHDKHILRKVFSPGERVLLYNSCSHLFPEKLRSKLTGPFTIHVVYLYEAVEIKNPKMVLFLKLTVND